jgi:Spy/CpxP family protein refolding chaperone
MKKALVALIAVAAVSPLFAQVDLPEPPPAVEAAHNQVVRFLQLDEAQVAAWDALWQDHRDAEQPLRDAIAALETELEALLAAPEPDVAAIGALVVERRDLGLAVHDVHTAYHDGVVALLDEEQNARLAFLARADDAQRFIPAFKTFELIPRR